MKSRGLGDEIAKLTRVTGMTTFVKKSVEIINNILQTDLDCGCEERQEKLNKLFPNKSKE